jgi:hypothetical protein
MASSCAKALLGNNNKNKLLKKSKSSRCDVGFKDIDTGLNRFVKDNPIAVFEFFND